MASGFEVNFKFEVKEVKRYLNSVQKAVVPKAEVKAINKTATGVYGVVTKEVARRAGVLLQNIRGSKKKGIEKKIFLSRANKNRRYAVIDATSAKAVNLIEFVPAEQRNPYYFRQQHGSDYRVKKKRGTYKFVGVVAKVKGKNMVVPGSFIGKDGRGRMRVFKRANSKNHRSRPTLVSGPSPRLIFISPDVHKIMRREANQRFQKEFDRAMEFELKKIGYAFQSNRSATT